MNNNEFLEEINFLKKENKRLKNLLKMSRNDNFLGKRNNREEKQLKVNKDKFFDLSLDLFCIADFHGHFLEVNKAWENLLGYSQQELEKSSVFNFIHPDDLTKTKEQLAKIVEGKSIFKFTNRYCTKNGDYVDLLWNAIPSTEEEVIYCVAHNVTEEKRIEKELRSSREKLIRILDSTPGGIVYADRDIRFQYVNNAYEQWIGKSKEEMIGKDICQVLGHKAFHVVKSGIERVFSGQKSYFLGKLPLYNGKVYDIDARLVPDFNIAGEVVGYFALVTDITERQEAKKQIRLQSAAMESAIDGISIIKNNKFVYVNKSKLNILGYEEKSDLIGKNWLDFYFSSEIKRFNEEIYPSLEKNKYWRGEIVVNRKDKTSAIEEISLTLVDKKHIIAVCRDITERKKAEDKLRIAEENYRSIFENALEGIFQSTKDGKYIQVNSAMASIYGFSSPEEMINAFNSNNYQRYVDDQAKIEFQRLLEKEDKAQNFEYEVLGKNNRRVWIQENTRAIRDRDGNLLYYEGIVNNITARKMEEKRTNKVMARMAKLSDYLNQANIQQNVKSIIESDDFKEIKSKFINEIDDENKIS